MGAGEWLKSALSEKGMTQKELAKECGLSLPVISKIIIGERYGSPGTWKKILSVVDGGPSLSVSSSDFINELKEEINLHGESYSVNVFYIVENGNIIFKDYLLSEDMKDNYKNDLKKMNVIQITLKEALTLFEAQDNIF